jgi:DNA polymerase-3 subunit epsilon
LSPRSGHRIIEIGAVALEGKNIVGEFHSMIDSGCSIDPRALAVHGITSEMLRGNPGPDEVFPLFHEFAENAPLIAHNARFDAGFLSAEFRRLGFRMTNKVHCTMELSRRLYPRLHNHRLDTVYRHLCGEVRGATRRHRALDDARLTVEVWLAMEGK